MPLFSFLVKSKYTFEGKKHYENVILLLFRHWFVILIKIIFFLILALVPFIIFAYLEPFITRTGTENLFKFLVAVYFLIWWYGLFYSLTMYLLDIWIVTDHRIIDSRQHGFFKRTVSELSLIKIQDVSTNISGFFQTLLDFGDLEIQTAGAEKNFFFHQIPHPVRVKDTIMHAHHVFVSEHIDDVEVHEDLNI